MKFIARWFNKITPPKIIGAFILVFALVAMAAAVRYPQFLTSEAIRFRRDCGQIGQPCCNSDICYTNEYPDLKCYAIDNSSPRVCQTLLNVCGTPEGSPCCDGDIPCFAPNSCSYIDVPDGQEYRNPWETGLCEMTQACGGEGEPCCSSRGAPGRCEAGNFCILTDNGSERCQNEAAKQVTANTSKTTAFINEAVPVTIATNVVGTWYEFHLDCDANDGPDGTGTFYGGDLSYNTTCSYPSLGNKSTSGWVSVTVAEGESPVVAFDDAAFRQIIRVENPPPTPTPTPVQCNVTGCSNSYPGCSYSYHPPYPYCFVGGGGVWPRYPADYICPDLSCPQPTPTRPPTPTPTPAPLPNCSGECYNASSCSSIGRFTAAGSCGEIFEKCCGGLIPPVPTPTLVPNGGPCTLSSQCQSRNCQYCPDSGNRCRSHGYICPS